MMFLTNVFLIPGLGEEQTGFWVLCSGDGLYMMGVQMLRVGE